MKKKKTETLTPKEAMKKRIKRKKIIRNVLIAVAILIASTGVYLGVGIYGQISGFSKEKLLSNQSSVQVASDGETEYYTYGSGGARKNVSYEDIPQVMIDAVVAAEDSRFFEHNGFDLPRIVKALMGNIVHMGITGGGSTITQQVIKKSYYPKEEQTIERKVGEIILAIEATSQVTKEEILELYLNKIYFGYGNKAIGIYAASKYYFDKSVQELTLPEAALLAGTLNSPNRFDPFKNLTLAQSRRDTILNLMQQHGYITKEECEATKAVPVENTLKSNPLSSSGKYQAYADKVTREVKERTGYDPEETPMRIYTYMNADLQEKLDDIANGTAYKFPNEFMQVGASVQESTTGRIVGVLSARNYEAMGTTYAYAASKKDAAENSDMKYGQRNQPGSSLKPIISYASAFEFLNYSTAHYVHDVPLDGSYSPKNWDNQFHGDVSVSEALSSSWNLAAIQTFLEVKKEAGNSKMRSYLEGFGFDLYKEGEGDSGDLTAGYAIGAWKTGVSPEEEAAAYAVIANGGTYIEPHTVQKIEILSTGEVFDLDEEIQSEKTQALSAESAFMIREVMTDYVKAGTSNYSRMNLGLQIGAKTGTSNHSTDAPNSKLVGKNKDLWMAAFSPDYSWSVWTGYNYEDQKKGYYPSGLPHVEISALIAKYVHNGKVNNSYPSQPSGVVKAQCVSGLYPYMTPGSSVPSSRIVSGWFKKDNVPSGTVGGSTLNNLSAFTASLEGNKISVNFTAYDPVSMTENATPTKTYTANGKSYTLPYLGDAKQILGKVVYVVDITDEHGNVVHTEKLSTNTATINYKPTAGTYTVSGYYAFESGSSTSNKINQTVTVQGATVVPATMTKGTVTATDITIQVTVPTGSTVTLTLSTGAVKTVSASGNVKFDGLTAGTEYKVTGVEKTSTGQTNTLTALTVKTADATNQ